MIFLTGDKLLDIDNGRGAGLHAKPTQHFTMIFNVFVMMTLFNEINARKIHGQRNVFVGLFTNPIYYVIWIATLISQVIQKIFMQKKYHKIMYLRSYIGKKTHLFIFLIPGYHR